MWFIFRLENCSVHSVQAGTRIREILQINSMRKEKREKEKEMKRKLLSQELLENGETSHITVLAAIPFSSVTKRVHPLHFFS